MIDRIPPHDDGAERAIIGCCLNTPVESIPSAQFALTSESFYDIRNRTIWELLVTMRPSGIDIVSVRSALKDSGILENVGGDQYLNQCQDEAFSSANIPTWIDILTEKQLLRRIIKVCMEAITDAYQNEPGLIERLERDILAIRPQRTETKDIKSLVQSAILEIEHRAMSGDAITGLTTGLIDLDKKTDGLHKGEMIVIAGFPSTGKTALAVNIAVTNALQGLAAAVFSAEMRPVKLVVRSICAEAKANFYRICEEDIPTMTVAAAKLSTSKLHIEQANRLSIGQVTAIARRMKQQFDIKLVVVDYIQLLSGVGDNREQEISSISKGIKAMAMELDLPVLALSQLTDDGKLRESRAIGQDADTVWKLENDGEWQSDTQPIMLRVEKCRDGATGKVNLTFLKTFTKFESASKVSDEDVPERGGKRNYCYET